MMLTIGCRNLIISGGERCVVSPPKLSKEGYSQNVER
jgi:hypothetical protein